MKIKLLEKGEIICPECNGIGYIKIKKKYFINRLCPLCLGMKKVDWLDRNKKEPEKVLIEFKPNSTTFDFLIEPYKKLDYQFILKELEDGCILRVKRVD